MCAEDNMQVANCTTPGELLPHPASAVEARHPQASDPDDAEDRCCATSARCRARRDGAGHARSIVCSWDDAQHARREPSSSSPTTRSGAWCCAPARSTYDLDEERRQARRRRRLSPARRAALSGAAEGAGARARPLQQGARSCGARRNRATGAAGHVMEPALSGFDLPNVKTVQLIMAGRPPLRQRQLADVVITSSSARRSWTMPPWNLAGKPRPARYSSKRSAQRRTSVAD